jgi:uncharacterized protein HemY
MNKYGRFYMNLDLKTIFIECDESDKAIHIVLDKLNYSYSRQLPVFMIVKYLKQLKWLDNRRKRTHAHK